MGNAYQDPSLARTVFLPHKTCVSLSFSIIPGVAPLGQEVISVERRGARSVHIHLISERRNIKKTFEYPKAQY